MSQEEEIQVDGVRTQLRIAIRRFETLSKSDIGAPAVMTELATTVMPVLGDIVELVDRCEQGVVYAQELAARVEDPESQLLPEDALRLTNYLSTVVDQARLGKKDLDPESVQYKGFALLETEGIELIKFVNEVTLTPDPDSADDPDEPDPDDESDESDEGNGADRRGDA